jgi:hypothetical protein
MCRRRPRWCGPRAYSPAILVGGAGCASARAPWRSPPEEDCGPEVRVPRRGNRTGVHLYVDGVRAATPSVALDCGPEVRVPRRHNGTRVHLYADGFRAAALRARTGTQTQYPASPAAGASKTSSSGRCGAPGCAAPSACRLRSPPLAPRAALWAPAAILPSAIPWGAAARKPAPDPRSGAGGGHHCGCRRS